MFVNGLVKFFKLNICKIILTVDIYLMYCVKRDQDKMSELNQQLIKMAKREETARNELAEQKKSAKAFAANSAEKLKAAQKEKLELMAALDKVGVIIVIVNIFLAIFKFLLFVL